MNSFPSTQDGISAGPLLTETSPVADGAPAKHDSLVHKQKPSVFPSGAAGAVPRLKLAARPGCEALMARIHLGKAGPCRGRQLPASP